MGIQQRAKLSALKAASVQLQKSLSIEKVEGSSYPSAIDSCPVPVAGSARLTAPSGYTVTYSQLPQGVWSSPVYAGSASEQSYEFMLRSDSSLLYYSSAERTGSNEFLQYMDMAPIVDQYGLGQYQINFEIKSANTSSASSANVYMQNGSGSKYSFSVSVPVTTSYTHRSVTVTPTVANNGIGNSVLAFYGTYYTGNILSVKNLEIIRVE